MEKKKILVLGGTGAMGTYLLPELSKLGYIVDSISLDEKKSMDENITYIKNDVMDDTYLEEVLKNNYDAVVDFMLYDIEKLKKRLAMFCENTKHYMVFSSYRVYADKDEVTTEASPRWLDVSEDEVYLSCKEKEYSLYKALEENIITNSPYKNWTIIRPSITFSTGRLQLTVLEAGSFMYRVLNNKKVLLPIGTKNVQATMSWAGDVGKLLARLVLNEKAYGEIYSACTSEHHTWEEIAEYYKELAGLDYEFIDDDEFLACVAREENRLGASFQLRYDRMVNRVMDNSKVLEATGIKQEDFTPLKEALKKEIANFSIEMVPFINGYIDEHMDEYIKKHNL